MQAKPSELIKRGRIRRLFPLLGSRFGLDSVPTSVRARVQRVNQHRRELSRYSDDALRSAASRIQDQLKDIAITAEVARRTVGLDMFDVQIQGALALMSGKIAEMQTGEGKTLAAVPAIALHAKRNRGVHVMTANDYLARRDMRWMSPTYRFLGLTVGCVQQDMRKDQRRKAYSCSVTYTTANEVGFDYLRNQLALHPPEQVLRPFGTAVIDEADSILIDEARIPLVVAGGMTVNEPLALKADAIVRQLRPRIDYVVDEHRHNVSLTDDGIVAVEKAAACGNLFEHSNFSLHAALQNSLHAHALLRRDVDYLVRETGIELVDEIKGRVAIDRRWPAALQTAIEAKERVALKTQGRILGSITLQNLIALYPQVCGMTGTAATQADEFQSIYGLDVEVIPTHKRMIRIDRPDVVFPTKAEKDIAVVNEIRQAHEVGRPVLVGCASVEDSERLSAKLCAIPHRVLNARDDEQEAAIIKRAGQRGMVTISTNMAGRGVDIQLGEGVADIGGLHVIGTNKHESQRIDDQLRGRAGRQGDPGTSQFLISLEDDLFANCSLDQPGLQHDPASVQRAVEGHNLEIRRFLHQYEGPIEMQRKRIQDRRQRILIGIEPRSSETERLVALSTIDDLWAKHLAAVAELREGIHWVSLGGREPLNYFLKHVSERFRGLCKSIEGEVARRMADAKSGTCDVQQRGATWTYLTTDQPFGTIGQRIFTGLRRKYRARRFWN